MKHETEGEAVARAAESIVKGTFPEGGSVELMLRLMLANAEGRESTAMMLYENEKAAHERTQERLAAALDRLDRIDDRFEWMRGIAKDFEFGERP